MNKLLCKLFGHKYKYNFAINPTKCVCLRCGAKWKSIIDPKETIWKLFKWVEDEEK